MLLLYSRISSSLFGSFLNETLPLLPTDMQERAVKYHRWQDTQAFVLGKLLLVKALAYYQLDFQLKDIQYTIYNRPYLPAEIDFNISHSGEYVICAVSTQTQVGIDIEEIRTINLTDFKSQWTNQEWDSIIYSPNPLLTFYTYWTQKEAIIKADGRGLNIPLNQIKLESDQAKVGDTCWYIKQVLVADGYLGHIVTKNRLKETLSLQLFTFDQLI